MSSVWRKSYARKLANIATAEDGRSPTALTESARPRAQHLAGTTTVERTLVGNGVRHARPVGWAEGWSVFEGAFRQPVHGDKAR